ncbi:hypothetical protein IMCC1989_2084 [gamma proteobacterium IMCC1989]|nr:hypothetical protein IMCC1989_2084 [gamma proteobacterium IMCC1989]
MMHTDVDEKLAVVKMLVSDAHEKCGVVQLQKVERALEILVQTKALLQLKEY